MEVLGGVEEVYGVVMEVLGVVSEVSGVVMEVLGGVEEVYGEAEEVLGSVAEVLGGVAQVLGEAERTGQRSGLRGAGLGGFKLGEAGAEGGGVGEGLVGGELEERADDALLGSCIRLLAGGVDHMMKKPHSLLLAT